MDGDADELAGNLSTLRHSQAERMLARHVAVRAYMKAIGQLAADDIVIFDAEFEALEAAAKDGRLKMDAENVEAIAGLAKLVSKMATDAWRQKELRQALDEANPSLQTTIAGLRNDLGTFISDGVEFDEQTVHDYFAKMSRRVDAAGQLQRNRVNVEVFDALSTLAAVVEADHLLVFGPRAAAIPQYDQVLKKIATGHQTLVDGAADLENDALLRDMLQRAVDLRGALRKLQRSN